LREKDGQMREDIGVLAGFWLVLVDLGLGGWQLVPSVDLSMSTIPILLPFIIAIILELCLHLSNAGQSPQRLDDSHIDLEALRFNHDGQILALASKDRK